LVVACAALLALPLLALAAPGDLDKGFAKKGVAVADIAPTGSGASRVAVMPDGKIIAGGMAISGLGEDSYGHFAVAAFTSKGALDTGFGKKGSTNFDFGEQYTFDALLDLRITDDDKILVGGDTYVYEDGGNGHAAAGVARLNSDGSLDTTLATDGTLAANPDGLEAATAVLPLPDGDFYAMGRGDHAVVIARFNADGTLDPAFAGDGATTIDGATEPGGAMLTSAGKIVLIASPANLPNDEFALMRFNADGTPDTTFGDNGVAHAPGKAVYELAQGANGDLVAAGGDTVARFDADGQVDKSFNDDGLFEFSGASGFSALGAAIESNGSVVVSGSAKHGKRGLFAVARLGSNGRLDRKFGTRGFASGKFGTAALGVALEDDGDIVAAGRTLGRSIFIGGIAGRETNVAVARFSG
jgi:uncharacterized delta-60 repeat protein